MNVQEFIQSQESELKKPINEINWTNIYEDATSTLNSNEVGQFTKLLLDLNIHPENYLSELPESFLNNTNIENFKIPDKVTSIGKGAFRYCSSLKSITIPNSVTSIYPYAFEDCGDIIIEFKGTAVEWREIEGVYAFEGTYLTVNCADGKIIKW